MPNCDFLAAGSDFDLVLTHVFESRRFLVYEHYSPYEQELLEFRNHSEVRERYPNIGQCGGSAHSALLQLLVPGTGSLVRERISLNPKSCAGATFRYAARGWGLIQLQLGGTGPKGLVASHTNHNSRARATKWEVGYGETLGAAEAWDWPAIEKASRSLNRFISKVAVRKERSRPVLPEAALLKAPSDV